MALRFFNVLSCLMLHFLVPSLFLQMITSTPVGQLSRRDWPKVGSAWLLFSTRSSSTTNQLQQNDTWVEDRDENYITSENGPLCVQSLFACTFLHVIWIALLSSWLPSKSNIFCIHKKCSLIYANNLASVHKIFSLYAL